MVATLFSLATSAMTSDFSLLTCKQIFVDSGQVENELNEGNDIHVLLGGSESAPAVLQGIECGVDV